MSLRITIRDTAYGGSGVGRLPDGKAVFVPFTVTGDEVVVEIVEDKGSFCVATLLDVVNPSEYRVTPHCQYHGICGGCHFGHISYEYQLEIKKNIVTNAFRKYPHKLPELKVFTADPLGYRVRATIRAQKGKAGFFRNNSNEFVPVESCPVIKPELYAKAVTFAEGHLSDEIVAMSVIENPSGEALISASSTNLEYQTAAGVVPVAYGGFFQANRYLIDDFQRYASGFAHGKVLELYAGSGFFTVAMMKNGCQVRAIEMNRAAAELAQRYNYPVESGDAGKLGESGFYNIIFVDPPREGVAKRTLGDILALMPEKVVYVSCNPMTLARDLARLAELYKVAEWALFDMFPHTYHVEMVVKLER